MTTDSTGPAGDAGTPGTGTTGADSGPWYAGFQDAGVKGWVESLNVPSPEALAQKAFHQERLLGADKAGRAVIWPKDANDTEGWKAIHAKLGVPEAPDGYGLKPREGQSDAFLKAAAPVLHQLGLSKAQAEGLDRFLNEYTAAQEKAVNDQIAAKTTAGLNEAKAEMGAAYAERVELAKRVTLVAGKEMGWDEGEVERRMELLESVWGTKEMLLWMGSLAAQTGEGRYVDAGGAAQRQYTPAAAKARFDQLMQDSAWLDKFAAGDAACIEEKNRLRDAMMAGQQAA